jgi:hypothetical protein
MPQRQQITVQPRPRALLQRSARPQDSVRLGSHNEGRQCRLVSSELLNLGHVGCYSDSPDRRKAFGSFRMTVDDETVASAAHCSSLLGLEHVICFSDPPDRRTAFGSAHMTTDDDVATSVGYCSSWTAWVATAIRPTVGQRSARFT